MSGTEFSFGNHRYDMSDDGNQPTGQLFPGLGPLVPTVSDTGAVTAGLDTPHAVTPGRGSDHLSDGFIVHGKSSREDPSPHRLPAPKSKYDMGAIATSAASLALALQRRIITHN